MVSVGIHASGYRGELRVPETYCPNPEGHPPQIVLLNAPLKAGDSWEYTIKTGGVKVMDKWVRTVKVKVPAGEFQAMRIGWIWYVEEKKAGSGTDWYAADVGLVKRVNDREVTVLKSFEAPKR